MSNRPTLTPDERPEWDDLIRAVVNGDMSSTDVSAKTHRLIDMLDDAEQAQRPWATRVMEEAAYHGMRSFLKTWLRDNSVAAYKSHSGAMLSISTRVGVERSGSFQQVLFTELTPNELCAHLRLMLSQRTGINGRIEVERRFLAICDEHPEAATVGEALAAAGIVGG